jgi:hypothetical protein
VKGVCGWKEMWMDKAKVLLVYADGRGWEEYR